MKLETCRRGLHVNRIEMRLETDCFGNKHTTEWHICRCCQNERKHATRRVVPSSDANWRSAL